MGHRLFFAPFWAAQKRQCRYYFCWGFLLLEAISRAYPVETHTHYMLGVHSNARRRRTLDVVGVGDNRIGTLSVRKIHPPNRNRYKIGPSLNGLSLLIRNCSKGLIRGHSPDQGGSRPTSSLASFLLPPVPCSPCGQADGQQRIYRRHTIRLI